MMSALPLCRSCGQPLEQVVIDLGEQPLANSYLAHADLARPEPRFPLRVRVCHHCWLVQTDATPDPERIFRDYAYFSSYSEAWMRHAREYCDAMIARFGLGPSSLVIEVASNDGYLLRNFVAKAIPCLGIEPALNVAEVARANGVATESVFLGTATAKDVVARHGRAKLVAANNVLAHVPEINDFVGGLASLLDDDGVLTVEFPHLVNLVELTQFDTIYHEHFSYLSLAAVERVFRRAGLKVFDVELLPTHGGSLRVFAALNPRGVSPELTRLREREAARGVETEAYYQRFGQRARTAIEQFQAFLAKAKSEGKVVAGYGAAAKGNTFLNACGATAADLSCVVDGSPHKQGTWLPGSRIPVYAPERIFETRPDYVVILPWNLKEEIAAQLKPIAAWGGRIVIAIPTLQVFAP